MMCDIKVKPENQEICRACLSSDRKLAFVAIGDIYCSLLTEDQKLDALSLTQIALCWECRALMRRTQRFREQVQKAYTILQDSLHLLPAKPTLSSLTIHRRVEYDAVFEENIPNELPLFYKAPKTTIDHDKVIIPTKYKSTEIKGNPAAKRKEGYVVSVQDVNKILTNIKSDDLKIEHIIDDSDDNEIFGADDINYSSHEDTSETKDDNIISLQKATKSSVPIVKPPLHSGITLKRKNYTPIPTCKPLNRKVDIKTEKTPLIKTPELLKLEMELKKLMAVNKAVATEPIEQKKCDKKKVKVNKDCNVTSKTNEKESLNISDIAEKEKGETYNENETKIKKQKLDELDPDFSLEEDEDNYATDDSEEFKQVPKNKTRKHDTDSNLDDDVTMGKRNKLSKTVTQYKNIVDVAPYFTEIEMSEQDLRNVLEKDDAIVNKNKPFKCTICGLMVKESKTLRYHGFRYHKGKYPSQFIKGKWRNPPPFFNHKSVWRCSICGRMMRQEHIVAHMNEYHRSRFKCTADGCEWVEKHIWAKEDLDHHWDAVHQQATCDICGETKKTKKLIELHIQSAHAPPAPAIAPPPIPPAPHKCPVCSKILSSRYYLQVHQQLVHEAPTEPAELRYCVECDITFKRIVNFQKHFSDRHSGKPKPTWPCEHCGKVLGNKDALDRHVSIKHYGITDYSCHICGKYLSRKSNLQKHLDSHNNIRAPRTLPCTVCGKMFQTRRVLKHHLYTHTGERPYKCPHCDAAFTQAHCLRSHLAKQHQVEARVLTDGTIELATQKVGETVDNVEK